MKRSRMGSIRTLRRDEEVPNEEPRRYRSGSGYIRLRWKVSTNNYVEEYEHRIVAGRPPEWMHVHHLNGDKTDNRLENLQVMTPTEHQQLHAKTRVYKSGREPGKGTYWPYRGRAAKEKAENRIAREAERAAGVARMRELYESGKSLPQVAEIVGIHHTNVYQRLKKAGVRFRTTSDYANPVEAAEVVEKYQAGRSQQSLAAEYRVTAQRIKDLLVEAGCPIRRPGRPKAHPRMAENSARLLVRQRSGGVCERCGSAKATEWHHRRNRSQGGPWSASNGLDLCSQDHRWITEHPDEACAKGLSVKSWDDETTIPVRTVHGLVLLDDEGSWKEVSDATA